MSNHWRQIMVAHPVSVKRYVARMVPRVRGDERHDNGRTLHACSSPVYAGGFHPEAVDFRLPCYHSPMTKLQLSIASLLAISLLSGCATEWHRPGTPKVVMERDLTHCDQRAAVKFPVRLVTVELVPGYMQPATQQCQFYGDGRSSYCQEYPAQWIPPEYGQRDANAGPRRTWVHACMRSLGFN
jgi:hypothetical protein